MSTILSKKSSTAIEDDRTKEKEILQRNENDCCFKLYIFKSLRMNVIRMKNQSLNIRKVRFKSKKET